MSTQLKTYRSLQAGRGLASVSIVLHHTFALCVGLEIGVAYFFVLSGVVMLLAHGRQFGDRSKLLPFLKKRFVRIYPIYWLVLLPYLLHPTQMPGAAAANRWATTVSFLLLPVIPHTLILAVAWTLQHEVVFYLVFSLMLISRRAGLVGMTIWVAAGLLPLLHILQPLPPVIFSELHLLFVLGLLCGVFVTNDHISHPQTIAAVGLTVLAATIIAITLLKERLHHPQLLGGLGSALVIAGTMAMEQHGRLHVPDWLNELGAASYSIYLIHVPVIFVLTRHTQLLASIHGFKHTAALSAVALISIFAGWILYQLAERPLLRLFGRHQREGITFPLASTNRGQV